MPNLNPARREDLQPRADAVEVRLTDQHPVAQADRRIEQHLVVPDQPHAVPRVSRPHRRSLTCRQSSAPSQFARHTDLTRGCRRIIMRAHDRRELSRARARKEVIVWTP
jgi:hypothetical protein